MIICIERGTYRLRYITTRVVRYGHRVGTVMVKIIERRTYQLIYSTEKMVPSSYRVGTLKVDYIERETAEIKYNESGAMVSQSYYRDAVMGVFRH